MKDEKEHLDLDLGFLDKKESPRVTPKPESPKGSGPNWQYYDPNSRARSNPNGGYNWTPLLIVVGIILLIVWATSSGSDSTSSPNAGSVTSSNGQYQCSQYDSAQADTLLPSPSEKSAIESDYVDEYSQASIDRHNAKVDAYNAKIQTYNLYLAAHCSR